LRNKRGDSLVEKKKKMGGRAGLHLEGKRHQEGGGAR